MCCIVLSQEQCATVSAALTMFTGQAQRTCTCWADERMKLVQDKLSWMPMAPCHLRDSLSRDRHGVAQAASIGPTSAKVVRLEAWQYHLKACCRHHGHCRMPATCCYSQLAAVSTCLRHAWVSTIWMHFLTGASIAQIEHMTEFRPLGPTLIFKCYRCPQHSLPRS